MGPSMRKVTLLHSLDPEARLAASGPRPLRRSLRRPRAWAAMWAVMWAAGWVVALLLLGCSEQNGDAADLDSLPKQPEVPRLISLNPSLTAIVLKLGRAEALVAVDDYSAKLFPEATAGLPKVGGLFNPNLESIVAMHPDRVLLVAGVDQQTHGARIERAGIPTEVFKNERFGEVLENIERLGGLLGREEAARSRVAAIVHAREVVSEVAAGRTSPAVVAVVDRSPFFVVGGDTFLDEMLEAVGANNLGRTLGSGYPRASVEWLIEKAPELMLDLTPGEEGAMAFWKRWPSLPAVSAGRVMSLEAHRISLPGPEVDRALSDLAAAVHGPEILTEINARLAVRPERAAAAR